MEVRQSLINSYGTVRNGLLTINVAADAKLNAQGFVAQLQQQLRLDPMLAQKVFF